MNRPMWLCLLVLAAFLIYAVPGAVANAQRQMDELKAQDITWVMFLSGGHNRQQAEIRQLKTELDQVKRQLAGELPQIQGGKTYEEDSIEND